MRIGSVIFAAVVGQAVAAQDAVELEIAREILTELQLKSFEKQREYCGYIGYDETGVMVATPAVAGTHDGCTAPFPRNVAVTASYHTHGDYDDGYFNEIPSDIDMEGDRAFYLNGYVATPGGRLWYIDSRLMVARQVCGIACLPVSDGFRKETNGEIAESYTYDALVEKLNN
ncbi:DUF4329 domain-containing protein [Yoonia sp. MH D7]